VTFPLLLCNAYDIIYIFLTSCNKCINKVIVDYWSYSDYYSMVQVTTEEFITKIIINPIRSLPKSVGKISQLA